MIDYKEILRSKPHNPHYLKKYISFIERHLNDPNDDPETFYEKHHILPKSADPCRQGLPSASKVGTVFA